MVSSLWLCMLAASPPSSPSAYSYFYAVQMTAIFHRAKRLETPLPSARISLVFVVLARCQVTIILSFSAPERGFGLQAHTPILSRAFVSLSLPNCQDFALLGRPKEPQNPSKKASFYIRIPSQKP